MKLNYRLDCRLDRGDEQRFANVYADWRRECACSGWDPSDVTKSAFVRALVLRALLDVEVDGIDELMIEDRRAVAA